MPSSVSAIWTVTLVVAYLCVPLLVVLLVRIVRAARKIEVYTRETRAASQTIVQHLEALPALDQTEALLERAHATGGEIALGAEALAAVLARRGGSG